MKLPWRPDILLLIAGGVLMNTSVVNIETFGVPIYTALLPLAVGVVAVKRIREGVNFLDGLRLPCPTSFLFALVILVSLSAVVVAHVLQDPTSMQREIRQLVARTGFVALFLVAAIVTADRNGYRSAVAYLKFFLKAAVLYGFYEFLARTYDLPLFLEFVRNSASFSIHTFLGAEGWNQTFRIRSIWAEPSFAALPLGALVYLLLYDTERQRERVVWGVLVLLYAFLTGSRIVWIVLALLLFLHWTILVLRAIDRKYLFGLFRLAGAGLVLVVIAAGAAWVVMSTALFSDLSSTGRSASVVIGLRIFADYPIFGSGFNSYPLYEHLPRYRGDLELLHSETLVHNVFVSYLQQMGIIGLVVAMAPIYYVLLLYRLPFERRIYVSVLFASIGAFSGDFYYFSLTWVMLGVLAAQHYLLSLPAGPPKGTQSGASAARTPPAHSTRALS